MKKVILPTTISDTVKLEDINRDKCYGFRTSSVLGFITKDRQGRGTFITLCAQRGLTTGNHYMHENDCLKTLISSLLEMKWEVFEFNKEKELFAWLAQ